MATAVLKSPRSFAELLSSLPAGASVLDLGSGPGTFDYRRYPHLRIRAVDEARPASFDLPKHVEFALGSASSIPDADGSFDLVIVNFAFEHFPDARAALREIERVLRDGGRTWISVPNAASFEDQLYRNLFAGGGHLQRPDLEGFLRQVYSFTSLKLISYMEIPAGFTYLGESEELRHFTWAVVDALRRTVGIDARRRSAYSFVLQKLASAGPGFCEHLRSCSRCGTPDGETEGSARDARVAVEWTCPACGERNRYPGAIPLERVSEVERAMRAQWELHPETRPERLHEIVEERTRWAQQLDREIERQRGVIEEQHTRLQRLEEELDGRGRGAGALDAELGAERERAARLSSELDRLRPEADGLRAEVDRLPRPVRGFFHWIERMTRRGGRGA